MANSTSLPPSQRTYSQPRGTVAAYFFLQFFGFASLSVLLLTFVSGRVKRDKTIWNLLGVFMVAAWASSLVFVSGTLFPSTTDSNDTPAALCLVNAAFIVGGTTSMSTAALNVVLHILLKILAAKGRLVKLAESKVLVVWFLASPWVCWSGFFIATVVAGTRNSEKVYKAVFYCAIENETLTTASAVVNAVVEVINLIVQISIGIILYQHHRSIKALRAEHPPVEEPASPGIDDPRPQIVTRPSSSSTSPGGVSIPFVFRLGLFQICVVAALCVCIGTINDFTSILGDFSITAIGPLVFFIFASQADVLRAWKILPSPDPIDSLPFFNHRSQSQPTPHPPSFPNDSTPRLQSSSSSAFDFELRSSDPHSSSSVEPKNFLEVRSDPNQLVDMLPFNKERREDNIEKKEESDGG